MPETVYDLPKGVGIFQPTSTTNNRNALLAKEAWANRLRAEAYEVNIDRWGHPRSGSFHVDLSDGMQWSTTTLGKEYTSASSWEIQELDESSEVLADEMSADQYLIFLSFGNASGFLPPLIERIEELAELVSMEKDQHALRPLSLRGFLRFLNLHRSRIQSKPQLILTADGFLRAIWRRTRDHRVAVRFLDHSRVSFVTFRPDHARPTQINRVGGESSVEGFFECAGLERLGVEFGQS